MLNMKKILIVMTITLLTSACASLEKSKEFNLNSTNSIEYLTLKGGLIKGNNTPGNEEQLALEGYQQIYHDQGANRAGVITLKKTKNSSPLEYKIIKGSLKDDPSQLDKLGQDGYELTSTAFHWEKLWIFYRPINVENRTYWKYTLLNDCHIDNKIQDIAIMADNGWIITLRDYESGNYCILKKDTNSNITYDVKIDRENIGESFSDLESMAKDGWELAARYYYSGHKGVYIKRHTK
ncbi:MAG: hypothetical protein H7A08_01505 [Oceanospirillaceae bacterium]|nr:hypothetical protein [Oceanospirillaceae bacterium]